MSNVLALHLVGLLIAVAGFIVKNWKPTVPKDIKDLDELVRARALIQQQKTTKRVAKMRRMSIKVQKFLNKHPSGHYTVGEKYKTVPTPDQANPGVTWGDNDNGVKI